MQKLGQGLVDRKLVGAPSNFIAGRPKAAFLFCLLLVVLYAFFLARYIVVSICLVYDSSIVATRPLIPAARFVVCLCFIFFGSYLLCLVNQNRTKGEGWSTANLVQAPSNFITSRPKAAPLFWFFGDFR